MSNVMSQVALEQPAVERSTRRQNPMLDIALRQLSVPGCNDQDLLRRFPTEVRLMIFEELLIVWPKIVFRGALEFGPLDEKEFDEEVELSWEILLTCRKYYHEAVPIMYGKNKFVFCTGIGGEPGMFWRFPIHRRYMRYLNDLGIYFRADNPKAESSKRVGHFLKALTRHAVNLEYLTVLASSDRLYEAVCPWDILFGEHPVSKELVHLIEAKTVRHLKIRLHDGACFFPNYASFLGQTFLNNGPIAGRSITFTQSCTCPVGCPYHPSDVCTFCGWPKQNKAEKPIEVIVSSPMEVESCMERMMDMQDELFQLGVLPADDEDGEGEDSDEDEYFLVAGPYRIPIKDMYDETQPAFDSGILLPGQVRRYRSNLKAPRVWYFRQTKITEYFKVVEYEDYLTIVFHSANLDG